MSSRKIGFVFTPETPKRETWQKPLSDGTLIYTKERKGNGVFMYNCEFQRPNQASATGFDSDCPELSREEVERIPRFMELVAAHTR